MTRLWDDVGDDAVWSTGGPLVERPSRFRKLYARHGWLESRGDVMMTYRSILTCMLPIPCLGVPTPRLKLSPPCPWDSEGLLWLPLSLVHSSLSQTSALIRLRAAATVPCPSQEARLSEPCRWSVSRPVTLDSNPSFRPSMPVQLLHPGKVILSEA